MNKEASLETACEHIAAIGGRSPLIHIHEADGSLIEWALANGGERQSYRATKHCHAFWNVKIEIAGVGVVLFPKKEAP